MLGSPNVQMEAPLPSTCATNTWASKSLRPNACPCGGRGTTCWPVFLVCAAEALPQQVQPGP